VRRDGLTVRATSIATIRPAMHVGLPQTNPLQAGVTAFALVDTCVQSPTGAAVTIPVTINPRPASSHAARAPARLRPAPHGSVSADSCEPDARSHRGQSVAASRQHPSRARPRRRSLISTGPVFSAMASGPPR
jgi:hypothetical protein